VGCPYTWGGTDPTNGGADCSGFVSYVFRHFGLLSGRYTSYGLRSVGSEVSYQNLQAGDIVCYPGHVGIYTGSGTIVEAQDTAHGITNYRSVNCGKIITIRRL
jgi:cell wall-associated NlpC family hydrolase